jgi:hypothetical protein
MRICIGALTSHHEMVEVRRRVSVAILPRPVSRASLSRHLAAHAEAWPRIAAALLGFWVLASLGLDNGGVLPRTWRLVTLALCALAGAALLARARIALSRLEWGVIAALAAYAGWIALSAEWSVRPTASTLQAERTAGYVAGVLAVLLIVERTSVSYLLGGMVAGVTAVSAYGLVEYVFSPPPLDPFEGRLLYQPLGYANALGIYAAIGILVAVGLAIAARSPRARWAALSPLVVLGPTLYFTSSRGAWLTLAAALPLLAWGGRFRAPVIGALAVLAVAAAVAVLVASGGVEPLAKAPGENRARFWDVALEDARDHPALGSGAGTYGDYWLNNYGSTGFSRTAHNVYLQALAELGPVGLLLLLTAVLLPLVCLRKQRDPLVAAAAAGYVAFLLHAAVDWDWELPATGLAGLLCGAAMLCAARRTQRSLPPWSRAALLAPVLAFALLAVIRLETGPRAPFGP